VTGEERSLNASLRIFSMKVMNPRQTIYYKEQIMKRISIALATFMLIVLPLASHAGADAAQRQIIERMQQQQQQLNSARAAQGAERQKLMAEHMKMMEETMGKMQMMKPKANMSAKDKDEWMTEHQKLMEQMMGQMMEEHHLMMQGMH